jgi:hypothetical protein
MPAKRVTVGEYLRRERAAEFRHNYLDGVVTPWDGGPLAHGTVSVNVLGILHRQLRADPCHLFTKGVRVYSGPPGPAARDGKVGMACYPDLGVVWGEPEFTGYDPDTLTNPTAVIEVLAGRTEAFDRGAKFHAFDKWTPTLADYLLVSTDLPLVMHFRRLPQRQWSLQFHTEPADLVDIPSIGCTLKLADVYDRVKFPDPEPDED